MSNVPTAPAWPAVFVPVMTPSGRKVHAVAVDGPWSRRQGDGWPRQAVCCLVDNDGLEIVASDRAVEVCRTCATEVRRYLELEL